MSVLQQMLRFAANHPAATDDDCDSESFAEMSDAEKKISKALLSKLNHDRKDLQKYCDVKVTVEDGKTFYAHRCVLGSLSEYFDRMFGSKLKEGCSVDVHVKGPCGQEITGKIMDIVLTFLYTASVDLDPDDVFDILLASDYMQITTLRNYCVDYLSLHVSNATCLKSLFYGVGISDAHLIRVASFHISRNIGTITSSEEFKCLTHDDVSALITNLNGKMNGSQIYLAIIGWVAHDKNERNQFKEKLVLAVDFKSSGTNDISFLEKTSKENFVTGSKELSRLLADSLTELKKKKKAEEALMKDKNKRREKALKRLRNMGCFEGPYSDMIDYECWDPRNYDSDDDMKYIHLDMMNDPENYCDMYGLDSDLDSYGSGDDDYMSSLQDFLRRSGESSHGTQQGAENAIVLVGGVGSEKHVAKYYPQNKRFESLKQLHFGSCNSFVARHGKKTFVIGGEMDGRRYLLPIAQVFDDGKSNPNNKWDYHYLRCVTDEGHENVTLDRNYVVSNMRQRKNAGFAQLAHLVYMFGGSIMSTGGDSGGVFGYLSSAEIIKINLEELNYETLPVQLLEKRSHHAVVELDGQMYIIGGEFDNCASDGPSVLYNTCEKYDPETNSVENIASLAIARKEHCACVFNGKIFVLGGVSGDGTAIKSVEIYCPTSRSWSSGRNMVKCRRGAKAAVIKGKLYVIGGSQTDSIERYDPANGGKWSIEKQMRFPRNMSSVLAVKPNDLKPNKRRW